MFVILLTYTLDPKIRLVILALACSLNQHDQIDVTRRYQTLHSASSKQQSMSSAPLTAQFDALASASTALAGVACGGAAASTRHLIAAIDDSVKHTK